MKRFLLLAAIAILTARITGAEPQPEFKLIEPHDSIADRGYLGIFLLAGADQDFRKIAAVLPNSPAANAGIIAGDYILAFDQYSTAVMSLDEFCQHAWAAAGTYTKVTLKRAKTGAMETLALQRVAPATLDPKIDDWAAYVPSLAKK